MLAIRICIVAVVGLSMLGEAVVLPEIRSESNEIFAESLNNDYTPCRESVIPCGSVNISRCNTQEGYFESLTTPQECPIVPVFPEGTCALLDGDCQFSIEAPLCVSWLPDCGRQYICTTEEDYSAQTNGSELMTCSESSLPPPPTPTEVCVPENDTCIWYDPCIVWQGFCNGDYVCGTRIEFVQFESLGSPTCAGPDLFNPLPQPIQEGECLYRDGHCEWSRCYSRLDECSNEWNCGTEYDYQVSQSIPSGCTIFTVHPTQPGICEYDHELGQCAFNNEGVILSVDLDQDYRPCRESSIPCEPVDIPRCTTQQGYVESLTTLQECPIVPVFPEGTCALLDGDCQFSTEAPLCVSWLQECTQYSCTTVDDYSARLHYDVCPFVYTPPTPTQVCVPENDMCTWYDPCTVWQGHCNGDYVCETKVDYYHFLNGPSPACLAPNATAPQPMPEGECLYRDGQCEWSSCRSWLDHCRTTWNCGSEYDYQVFQTLPVPPCAPPGEFFIPPIEPGTCELNSDLECAFNDEVILCEDGKEYSDCGSPCPVTCDNFLQPIICPSVCSQGCFCPEGTVLHNNQCIPPIQCPNACEHCQSNQYCEVQQVQCVQAPCPPMVVCIDKVFFDVQQSGTGVEVVVTSDGARSIRVIVRDSSKRRYTQIETVPVTGNSVSFTLSHLPRGRTNVRANVRLEDRSKISTEWTEIILS